MKLFNVYIKVEGKIVAWNHHKMPKPMTLPSFALCASAAVDIYKSEGKSIMCMTVEDILLLYYKEYFDEIFCLVSAHNVYVS